MRISLASGLLGSVWRFAVVAATSTLVACGGPGGDSGGTTNPTPTPTPAPVIGKVFLSASQKSVKTDNSDSATITATVLDANNTAISGASLTFKTTSGQLVVPSGTGAVSDASGKIVATYSAGSDRSNRTDTITVSAANGVSAQLPITVSGTQLTLTAGSTALTAPSGSTPLTATLVDAGNNPISSTPIQLTAAGTGTVSLSASSLQTGEQVTVTGSATGVSTVTASALGAQASVNFTVTGGSTGAFGITSPAAAVSNLTTGSDLSIVINAPGLSTVRVATTLGTLTDTNSAATGSFINAAVVGNTATVKFNSSVAGMAIVQVTNPNDASITGSVTIAVSPPVSSAANISLQGNPSTIPISTGSTKNSLSLRATVTTAAGQPVANVPVQFQLENTVGGGEFVSPAVAFTNAVAGSDGSGVGDAVATFTSGTKPSGQGGSAIRVKATIVGTTISTVSNVVISGVANSVTIGQSSVISADLTNTAYILPMSVQVADSAGNAVKGAVVNLKVRPVYFSTGTGCSPFETFVAEDATVALGGAGNGNGNLDANEDGNRYQVRNDLAGALSGLQIGTKDGQLTPTNANAGTVPTSVTTTDDGTAAFNLTYLKSNSIWTVIEMTASTLVQGTESKQSVTFRLAASESDASSDGNTCHISNSPYQK
ncbi:beta strand repeat-containing protein [Chitinimonas koreensis]|uniref:beta strand repeat-containing protein n=1 Tax=Chitinimonas koreensis TaxID=356302 RepID=UPI000A067750|nr:hypothetical protein [Chitinimonas koreensis]QNM97654.1 hypothetical protein H9L41_04970 [Chitinimonas koreensis]